MQLYRIIFFDIIGYTRRITVMKKLTQVYLIRHSKQLKIGKKIVENEESQISNEKIILSIEGERKAEEISQLKELKNIDILWSSNYARAIGTAKYIAEQNNIEINVDENFNERKLRKLNNTIKTRGN